MVLERPRYSTGADDASQSQNAFAFILVPADAIIGRTASSDLPVFGTAFE
jgi:hypothetical protein